MRIGEWRDASPGSVGADIFYFPPFGKPDVDLPLTGLLLSRNAERAWLRKVPARFQAKKDIFGHGLRAAAAGRAHKGKAREAAAISRPIRPEISRVGQVF